MRIPSLSIIRILAASEQALIDEVRLALRSPLLTNRHELVSTYTRRLAILLIVLFLLGLPIALMLGPIGYAIIVVSTHGMDQGRNTSIMTPALVGMLTISLCVVLATVLIGALIREYFVQNHGNWQILLFFLVLLVILFASHLNRAMVIAWPH
jgi:MFS family permease